MERSAEDFHNLDLVLDSDVKIFLTSWNWTSSHEADWLMNISLDAEMYAVLLKADPDYRIVEKGLSNFSYALLSCFSEKTCVEKAVNCVIDSFEVAAHEEAGIRKVAMEQIKEAVWAGILVVPD
jgi:hypothetical protein